MPKFASPRTLFCAAACTLLSGVAAAQAATPPATSANWVGTWATAPMAYDNAKAAFGAADATGTTLREIVHISIGGPSVRIVFTNEFGSGPLQIDAAAVAHSKSDGKVKGTVPLTFGGQPGIVIPAGALVISDPVDLNVAPLSDLAISLFLPSQTIATISRHGFADQTSYAEPGNEVSDEKVADTSKKIFSWDFVKGVDVAAAPGSASIVAFGDSITDGAHSTRDENARWPDILAQRLHKKKDFANLGVLNEGIGGNRVLHDDTGPNALARFDRDVIAQAGVRYVIVLESINDIGRTAKPKHPGDEITAQQLIVALQQIITRAHLHGIKVIGATLTPYKGAQYESDEGLKMWAQVNDFIRNSGKFDGVVDFAKVTADPHDPEAFAKDVDSGDNLHPGDLGYRVMGNAIDLNLFTR